jgi:hypothetical protein
MLVETVLVTCHRLRAGDAEVLRRLHLSTRIAYS